MNCARIWGPSEDSGRIQRPKTECPPLQSRIKLTRLVILYRQSNGNCSFTFQSKWWQNRSIGMNGMILKNARTFPSLKAFGWPNKNAKIFSLSVCKLSAWRHKCKIWLLLQTILLCEMCICYWSIVCSVIKIYQYNTLTRNSTSLITITSFSWRAYSQIEAYLIPILRIYGTNHLTSCYKLRLLHDTVVDSICQIL